MCIFLPSRAALPLIDDDEFAGNDVEDAISDEVSGDKIVGGVNTTIQAHPHQISFRHLNRHICGGSILTATRALTAGQCIYPLTAPSQLSIMAGSTLRLGDANQQVRTLTRMLRHPRYASPMKYSNDIMLLYWAQPLTFGANVRAIRLVAQGSPVPYGRDCNVTGYGRIRENGPSSDVLQVITKPLVSYEQCKLTYGDRLTRDMLCAGLPEGGRDSCQGDSGGALTVNGIQLGVVSWGHGCARPRFPGVYANVATFTNWIRENL